jgi:hypothetical protein
MQSSNILQMSSQGAGNRTKALPLRRGDGERDPDVLAPLGTPQTSDQVPSSEAA